MTYDILQKNKEKNLKLSFPLLLCFAMFSFWQMGFIYFMGPALNIDGRTPLPISMDNLTALIAVAYVLCIIFMILVPHMVIWTGRIMTSISLLSAIGLFFPFSADILHILIYIQVFCCCYMIGFETFILVNLFSEETTIKHLTLAYGVIILMISIVQNDFFPITFPVFRIVTVFAIILLLIFYVRMPASRSAYPQYIKKGNSLVRPTKLMTGTFIFAFVAAVMGVSGPSIAGEITHGIFIAYFVDALVCIVIYVLYKKFNLHPFRSISLCIGMGAVGYLLMIAADYAPSLSYLACALIGIGVISCQMIPLFGTMLMKMYPSKYYAPVIIGLALMAVLVQSSMVEIFRSMPSLLYLAYSIIMVVLVFIYLKYEPHFIYVLIGKTPIETSNDISDSADTVDAETSDMIKNSPQTENVELLSTLTKREKEVLELISCGYSNADIAQKLVISEHTVNDYTKKIYRKLDVHSRYAAANFLLKHQNERTN